MSVAMKTQSSFGSALPFLPRSPPASFTYFLRSMASEGNDFQTEPVPTLRVTSAMQAGLADHVWELEELMALLD
jgi:hypothetical protein